MRACRPLIRLLTVCFSLLAMAAGVVTATGAAAAADTPMPSFGVQFHGMWAQYTDAQRDTVLTQMKDAGIKWIRLDLGWATLQPSGPGSFDMTWGVPFTDGIIDKIHNDGFHLLVTYWRTPGWANAGAGETALPTDPQTYADSIKWAAQRYAGKVDAWEIWNEPNQSDYMVGASPTAYTKLLQAAYPAVHAGDPNAQVVFGGPSENDDPWIAKAYAAGAHGYFDVMATHPYQQPGNEAPSAPDDGSIYKLAHVAAVHKLMADNGDGGKPIWFTEFGWATHPNTAGMPNWELGVTPAQQGDFLVQTLQLIHAKYPYVTNAFWYEASDQHTGSNSNYDNYGLLDSSLAPKPAYDAIKTFLTGTATAAATPAPATIATPTPTPTSTPTPVSTDPGVSTTISADLPSATTDSSGVATSTPPADLSAVTKQRTPIINRRPPSRTTPALRPASRGISRPHRRAHRRPARHAPSSGWAAFFISLWVHDGRTSLRVNPSM
jgi:hypothetical protein